MHTPEINLALAQWLNKAIDIGIVSSKYALYIVNSVNCCCLLCRRFELVEVSHHLCLVWPSNIESSNVYAAQGLNRLFQLSLWNPKCNIGAVEAFCCKSCVLHSRRQ